MTGETNYRNEFERRFKTNEARFGIIRESRDELPVIDVGPLVEDAPTAAKQVVADEIRDALINSGFFYMTNYGITEDEMLEVRERSLRFFHMRPDRKGVAKCTDATVVRGWQPIGAETITPGYEADYKEYYDFGLNRNDESVPVFERGMNKWPSEDDLPGFRAFMENHIQRMLNVGQKLMRGFALSLDLPETYFDKCHEHPFYNLRASWYPPGEGQLNDKRWSCGPHTDYMTLTMLYQDHVGGLEVMNLDGEWIPASPIPGTQVVNIGDMMSSWTNDLYTSNPHRVRNLSNEERISLATFMGPDFSTKVSCLETCMSEDNPARYPPITCAEHVTNIIADTMTEASETALSAKTDASESFRSSQRIGAD